MRILLTNDDGIHAPGLAVLEGIARTLSDDVWVVAPETEQSGASRALTLSQPVRVRAAGDKRFAVSGTPTDCVLLAHHDLMQDSLPDLVLSGVNAGQNIAEDTTFSGTIAAAMQAMQLGIPAMALSQAKYFRPGPQPIPFETAAAHGPGLVRRLLDLGWPTDVIMSINFPDVLPDDVTGTEVCAQGKRDQRIIFADKRTDLRGNAYYWLGFKGLLSTPPEGVDLRAIYEHRICITPLHVDLTEHTELARLRAAFG